MNRKCIWIIAVILALTVAVPAFALTSLEKEELYQGAVQELETYLEESENDAGRLYGIQDTFQQLGGYEESRFLGYYVDVLIHLAEEEYDFWLDNRLTMLQNNAEFAAYLQDSLKGSSLGSASTLAKYAEARQLEHEGRIEAAAEAYYACLDFYDASLRYNALVERTYDAQYTEANNLMKQGAYASAYIMLRKLGKYRDSESLAAAIEKQIGYAPTSAKDMLNDVTNLEAIRQGERKVEAKWKKAAHAETYKVYGRSSRREQWKLLLSTRNDWAVLRDDVLYAKQCELKVTACSGQLETKGTIITVPAFVKSTPTPTPKKTATPTPTPRKTNTPTPKRTATPTPKATSSVYGYTILSDGTIQITSFYEKNKKGMLTVPETIDGHQVTSIGKNTFASCSGISEIVLPDSITEIGEAAFNSCTALTKINIPNQVKSIGSWAFAFCEKMREIRLPQSIQKIYDGAFSGCTSLEKLTLPESITEISDFLCCECTSLREFFMGNAVKSIGEHAFGRCSIESIYLTEGLEIIGESAFSHCSKLSYIFLPNSLRSLGKGAFEFCSNLTWVTFPEGLTRIEDWTFYKSGLRSVDLPNRLTYIGAMAFSDCPLTKVSIPASITYIDTTSFEYEVAYTVVKGSYAERFCKKNNYKYYAK